MKKAQTVIEYTLVAGVVIAALIAMQGYMKRGIQAVVKVAADDIGDEKAGGMDSDPLFKRQIMAVPESTTSTSGTNTFQRAVGGEVTYGTDTTTTTTAKDGIISSVLSWEREN